MKARSRSSLIPTKRSSRAATAEANSRRLPPAERCTKATVLRELKGLADPRVRAQMAYFGVRVPKARGITAPVLHALSRRIGRNHQLAEQLWASGIHEAKILATLIGEPEKVTSALMDRWARDFNGWDVVDSCCRYLFVFATPAWSKIEEWSRREKEYVKRAAFSLMAYLSYLDKESSDARFARLFRTIERESDDERNFVRKAVNWALRQIGKRNLRLNREAIQVAERIRLRGSRAARWIAADALRELKSEAVQKRLRQKSRP
jgi:3-methyladenine DNA glycosylase AlkD